MATVRMDASLRQFNKDLSDFSRKRVPAEIVLIQKRLAFSLLRRVVLLTPVDTGRARGNWQLTIGSPATSTLKGGPGVSRSGKSSRSKGDEGTANQMVEKNTKRLASLQPFQIVWLTNNMTYITMLEKGWSKQAANGMLAVALEEEGAELRGSL